MDKHHDATYPICVDCKHYEKKPFVGQGQQLTHIEICQFIGCRHPVTGFAIPAEQARGLEKLCSLSGRFFDPAPPKVDQEVIIEVE